MSELPKIFIGAVVTAAVAAIIVTLAQRAGRPQSQIAYAAPAQVIEVEGTRTGAVLDPNVKLRPNDWFETDLDGDGRADRVMLQQGDLLYWSKNAEDGFKPAIPICKIKFHPYAYAVGLIDGKTTLQFWDDDRREYRQVCLGVDGTGKPYFGEVEQR
jgi:hypothetical protein